MFPKNRFQCRALLLLLVVSACSHAPAESPRRTASASSAVHLKNDQPGAAINFLRFENQGVETVSISQVLIETKDGEIPGTTGAMGFSVPPGGSIRINFSQSPITVLSVGFQANGDLNALLVTGISSQGGPHPSGFSAGN